MTCPIGGERFTALKASHYSLFDARPDGRAQSSWIFPLPLPICPANGLVVLKQYTPAEVAVLTPLIASADYRRMMREDTSYYRAQWIASRIGMGETVALELLLTATWQAKPDDPGIEGGMPSASRAAAYNREFAARVKALPPSTEPRIRLALTARAANALREVAAFAEADAMRTTAVMLAASAGQRGWDDYLTRLGAVIARRDASLDPIDMAPAARMVARCIALPATAPTFDRAFCAAPERRPEIERIRGQMEQARARRDKM